MRSEDVHKVYDSGYANDYNQRFLLNPFSKVSADTELAVLKKMINADSRWLDLGCGTGYFLSCFPGVKRAGLDLSPEMVKVAQQANPDAIEIRQGDFRNPVPEWNASWSLVSCMWAAYSYVDSVKDFEQLMKNIIDWVAEGGAVFMPIIDIEDVRPNMIIPYEKEESVFGGKIAITSVTWTWNESESGKIHTHLVAPHVDHFIRLLEPFFDTIEIVRYPPYMAGWVSRKGVLATGRRPSADYASPAKVIWQKIPPPFVGGEIQQPYNPLSALSYKILVGELARRARAKIFSKKS